MSETRGVLAGGVSSSVLESSAFRPRFFVSVVNSHVLITDKPDILYRSRTSGLTSQQVLPFIVPASVHLLHDPISAIFASTCNLDGPKIKSHYVANNYFHNSLKIYGYHFCSLHSDCVPSTAETL